MNGIFRNKNNQPINWFNRSSSKSNQYCLYCGEFVGEGAAIESNKEHLIGREFVPTGEFRAGSAFNFIFRACKKCNDEKSNVERHISSVTLLRSRARLESQGHNEIACRKARKDFHPDKKGVLIKNSGDNFNVVGNIGNMKMTAGLSAPPKANPDNTKLLAFRHIQGIFSLITSRNPLVAEGTCLLSAKYFKFFDSYHHDDWGNPHMLTIMERVSKMPCRARIVTANGFFKLIMRRDRGEEGEWFWALEWNKTLRLVGAIAQPESDLYIFKELPSLKWHDLGLQDGVRTRMREELPLKEEQDQLFLGEVERTEIT